LATSTTSSSFHSSPSASTEPEPEPPGPPPPQQQQQQQQPPPRPLRRVVRQDSSRVSFAASVKALASPRLEASQQRLVQRLHRLRSRLLVAACALCALGMASGMTAAQMIFWRCYISGEADACPARERDATTDALKFVTTASTLALLLVLGAHCLIEVTNLRLSGALLPHESVFATSLPLRYALGMFLCALHCPAGVYRTVHVVSFSVEVVYDYDSLLAIALVLRPFVLFPYVVTEFTGLRTASARVIERFHGVKVGMGYALRLLLERAPLTFSLVIFVAIVFASGYALHVAERPVCMSAAAIENDWCSPQTMRTHDFSSFSNSLWNAIITALTGEGGMQSAAGRTRAAWPAHYVFPPPLPPCRRAQLDTATYSPSRSWGAQLRA
jgi:hypothetical protein